MQLLITGPPGSLFDHVCGLLEAAATLVPEPVTRSHGGPDSGWTAQAAAAGGATHVFITNHPSGTLLDAVRDGRLPAIVILDTPARSFMELRDAGQEAMEAARNLSACATPLGELAASPTALRLGAEARTNQAAALRAIAGHAGWTLPADPGRTTIIDVRNEPPPLAPSCEAAALTGSVLEPAFHFAATGRRRASVWPRACLFWGDHPDQAAPAILDLTGPARVIVYGPYFHLAPGHWTARAALAFSPDAIGANFALEFHATNLLGRCRFQAGRAGVFQVELPIRVPSARETIELRLVLERGAIEGHLGLDDVHLMPTGFDHIVA